MLRALVQRIGESAADGRRASGLLLQCQTPDEVRTVLEGARLGIWRCGEAGGLDVSTVRSSRAENGLGQ